MKSRRRPLSSATCDASYTELSRPMKMKERTKFYTVKYFWNIKQLFKKAFLWEGKY